MGKQILATEDGKPITSSNLLPVSIANTPNVSVSVIPTIGTHANAWNAAAVGAGGTSTSVDARYNPFVSAFGNASASTTITIQVSQDNTNWYDSNVNIVLAAAADFYLFIETGARYIRLKSSAAATITATIAGKD